MQETTLVENPSIPLILLTGSAYFVKESNINSESFILIGWCDKRDNRIGKYQSTHASQKPIKAGFWHQKFQSESCFWSANTPVDTPLRSVL